ncbi:MAG TPA: hypothetical protein VG246_07410 [Acidimicrobiales bacterium]|jgi:hypothetical protein|nr:hypothetical protein [Acidimicrobiales bacterium]
MVVEVVFGTILIILAVCAGVGLPLLAVHFQQREVHERNLVAEVEHQKEATAVMEEKVEVYHDITNIHPDQIPVDPEAVAARTQS